VRRWWLVIGSSKVDLCLDDPGFPIDSYLFTDLLTLTEIFMGEVSFAQATSSGKLIMEGPTSLTRSTSRWCARNKFVDSKRPRGVQRGVPPGPRSH